MNGPTRPPMASWNAVGRSPIGTMPTSVVELTNPTRRPGQTGWRTERLGSRTHGEAGGLPPPASRTLGTYSLRQVLTHQLGPSSRTPRAEGAIGGALLGAYWTFAVSEASAFKVKVQVGVLFAPLLHTPDQSTERPVTLRVMRVPA